MDSLLTFSNLCITAGSEVLLNHCSGDIQAGDFIILTGRSGSGKSLLLRAISGLQALDSGELALNNQLQRHYNQAQWRHHVALIAQNPKMSGETVEDTLRLPLQFSYHRTRQWNQSYHIDKLKQLGKNKQFLHQDINHLSGGEKQLINLLRTLQLGPSVLLLDEPTAALDNHSRHSVEQLVKDWLMEKPTIRAVVWISHDDSQLNLGNRHWIMHAGNLTEGSP